ncbi:MAG: NUDIX domain-containing protein [Anaerolineae bacterium]|jgi:8-oxo-dGTP pyrophosphatase MutT (NUDIX family)
MSRIVEKVTAFVTRSSEDGQDLLLFQHPNAGVQVPAGTVEEGETPEAAVLREAVEETGLAPLTIRRALGCTEQRLPEGQRVIDQPTKVYARPDPTSFDWAYLRTGIRVTASRRSSGFSQVTYEEYDCEPDRRYVTMAITGWVPDEVLADTICRHFYELVYAGPTEERWTVFTDNHTFTLFWAPLADLPEIVAPQNEWLELLFRESSLPAPGR